MKLSYKDLTANALGSAMRKLVEHDRFDVKTAWSIGVIAKAIDEESRVYNATLATIKASDDQGDKSYQERIAELKSVTKEVYCEPVDLSKLEGLGLTPAELISLDWCVAP